MLLTSTAGFIAAALLGRHLGPTSDAGKEPLLLLLAAYVVVLMPASLSPPIRDLQWAALGVGLLAVEAFWALHRYPIISVRHTRFVPRLASAVGIGLLTAIGLSILATLIIAVATASGNQHGLPVLPVIIGGYVAGGVLAGALVAALQPLGRWPLGTMLLGVLGGALAYGALSPAVQLSILTEGKPAMTLAEQIGVSIGCGVAVGPPVALMMRYGRWGFP